MKTEEFVALCKINGFSLSELKDVTVDFAIQASMEVVNIKSGGDTDGKNNSQPSTRKATQADFDAF